MGPHRLRQVRHIADEAVKLVASKILVIGREKWVASATNKRWPRHVIPPSIANVERMVIGLGYRAPTLV